MISPLLARLLAVLITVIVKVIPQLELVWVHPVKFYTISPVEASSMSNVTLTGYAAVIGELLHQLIRIKVTVVEAQFVELQHPV